MKKILLILLSLLLFSCKKPLFDIDSVSYVKYGDQILIRDNNEWYVYEDNILYPGAGRYISGFLTSLHKSRVIESLGGNQELYNAYGITGREDIRIESEVGILSISYGKNTPGSLGRYVKFNSSDSIDILEGDFISYPIYKNCKDLNIQREFTSFNSLTSYFTSSDSKTVDIDFKQLLRADVIDLVKDSSDFPEHGYITVETDNGKSVDIEVKKRAENYLLNFQAPYSYFVSEETFKSLF